jgi:hypothetical protein
LSGTPAAFVQTMTSLVVLHPFLGEGAFDGPAPGVLLVRLVCAVLLGVLGEADVCSALFPHAAVSRTTAMGRTIRRTKAPWRCGSSCGQRVSGSRHADGFLVVDDIECGEGPRQP